MGAVTGAVIGAAATLGSAAMANRGARQAAAAQRDAANAGIAEQQAAREQFQENIAPYLGFGQEGIAALRQLMADPSSIQNNPAYQWRVGQGLQALDRSAAAGGALGSGGHAADLLRFGQGMASQELDNQWARLMGVAGLGQNSAVGAGSMGQQSANAISGLLGDVGQAGAGRAINSANAWGNALAGLSNVAGNYLGSRQSSYQAQPAQTGWGAFTPSGGMGLTNNSLISGNYSGLNGGQNSLIWGNYGGLNGWRG